MTRALTPNKAIHRRQRNTVHTWSASNDISKHTQYHQHQPLEEISSNFSASIDASEVESPAKPLKGLAVQTPHRTDSDKTYPRNMSPPRSFGEEIDYNFDQVIIDTTLLNLSESKNGTAVGRLMTAKVKHADESTVSDNNTEVSSVAHLRGWLDDFGKQQKKHFENNTKVGQAPEHAQRPTRPKVVGSTHKINRPTPLPPPAASALAKRLVDTGLPRSTPVRIQTKVVEQDVRATNDGYKSVKELSAWLADDPTKSKKKIKCLRRGANVIAKSRAFDKGLKDIIIEQDMGGASVKGLVAASKKKLLAPSLSGVLGSAGESYTLSDAESDWPTNDRVETATSLSVSEKKQWLVNAFKKADQSQELSGPKAHTVLVTSQDERQAVSDRAKHLWRQRSKHSSMQQGTPKSVVHNLTPQKVGTPYGGPTSFHGTPQKLENQQAFKEQTHHTSHIKEMTSSSKTVEVEHMDQVSTPTKYGFSAAREFLIQKSRQNGNPVDVNKVKNRAAKFEKLEKKAQHKASCTTNMMKTVWVENSKSDGGHPTNTFVRTLVSNTAPKKSINELP